MEHRERRGVIWLMIVTLTIVGLGFWLRNRKQADSVPTAVTVYKIETDTVYRQVKKRKNKKKATGNNVKMQIKRRKEKGSAKIPAVHRDFLEDTISRKPVESE